MTAYTSTGAGNWSSTGIWDGDGGPPANGDTATISHNVAVDANTTVGTSPANNTTDAITVNTGVNLTINEDITLTCRGRLHLNPNRNDPGSLVMSAGSTLILDGSQEATDPQYELFGPFYGALTCNGTAAKHCTIRGYDATHRGKVYMRHLGATVTCDYVDFQYLGTGTGDGVWMQLDFAAVGGLVETSTYIRNCTFDDVSKTDIRHLQTGTGDFVVTNNTWTNSGSNGIWFRTDQSNTTGTRTFSGNVFDEEVRFSSLIDFGQVTECYFGLRVAWSSGAGDDHGNSEMVDCLLRSTTNESLVSVDSTNCYVMNDLDVGNPHFIELRRPWRNVTIDGCVFEYTGSYASDSGDVLQYPASGGTYDGIVQNCFLLPDADNKGPAVVTSLQGDADTVAKAYHNTVCVGPGAAFYYGETYAGYAGIVPECKSNLVFKGSGYTGSEAWIGLRQGGSSVQDGFTATGADYNARSNLNAGSEGRGWDNGVHASNLWAAGNAAAAGVDDNGLDISEPRFLDVTRDLASWGATEAGTDGTVAAALTVIRGDTTKIADMVTWIKAGFGVRNALLNGAAHDGGVIGAGSYINAGVQMPMTGVG